MTPHRAFVTGGLGFVGRPLVRQLLAAGCEVAVLVRPSSDHARLGDLADAVRWVEGDLANPDSYRAALRAFQPEVCFHLAWVTEPGKYVHSPHNADFLLHSIDLLRAVADAGCGAFVGVGTCLEYAPSDALLTEDAPLSYSSPYAAAKNFTRQLCASEAERLGVALAWGRLFYMYGAGDHPRRLIPALIGALREGRRFPTTDGLQRVDYLAVEDVAAGLLALAGQRGAYNVCAGEAVAVAEVIRTVAEAVGRPDLIGWGEVARPPDQPLMIAGDRRKLTDATGWAPRLTLADGLRAVVVG
jgi:nucleoside-diphosphate-sugar epimerase